MKSQKPLIIVASCLSIVIAGQYLLSLRRQSPQVEAAPLAEPAGPREVRPASQGTGELRSNRDTVTVTRSALPERVQRLLAQPDVFPSWAAIQKLQPEDLPTLKSLYRREQAITNRMALMLALAVIGDESVVDMFQYSLFREFTDKTLSSEEAKVLKTTVIGLGILANHSDRAYDVLKRGTDYGYWRFRRTWKAEREYDGYPDYGFVNRTIQALALSGRPGFPEIIGEVTKRDADYLSRMDGAIITALALHELARTKGWQEAIRSYITDGGSEALRAWRESPMSASWDEWQAGSIIASAMALHCPCHPRWNRFPMANRDLILAFRSGFSTLGWTRTPQTASPANQPMAAYR